MLSVRCSVIKGCGLQIVQCLKFKVQGFSGVSEDKVDSERFHTKAQRKKLRKQRNRSKIAEGFQISI